MRLTSKVELLRAAFSPTVNNAIFDKVCICDLSSPSDRILITAGATALNSSLIEPLYPFSLTYRTFIPIFINMGNNSVHLINNLFNLFFIVRTNFQAFKRFFVNFKPFLPFLVCFQTL